MWRGLNTFGMVLGYLFEKAPNSEPSEEVDYRILNDIFYEGES